MKELKKISVLTTAAMLLAISVILSFLKSQFHKLLKFGLDFYPLRQEECSLDRLSVV